MPSVAPGLGQVGARKPGGQHVDARGKGRELADVGVLLDSREACGEHGLRRPPPLAQQLRLDRVAESPVEAQLDPSDAGEQASDLQRAGHERPPRAAVVLGWLRP